MDGRSSLLIALFAAIPSCLVLSAPVRAGAPSDHALYRCKGSNGFTIFTNAPKAGCVVIGTYASKSTTSNPLPSLGVPEKDGWTLVTVNGEEEIRTKPARTVRGAGWVRTWLMARYFEPQGKVAHFRKLVSQTYINCNSGEVTMGASYAYDSAEIIGGRLVGSSDSSGTSEPPPDSTGDQIVQFFCHSDGAH